MAKKFENIEFHSVANIFPMMTETEFESLKNDILINGQREPIWVYEGKIIDGRNRYKATIALGKKPIFRNYEGDEDGLLNFVVSLNLHRRHLTTSQRACLAVALTPELEKVAKENLRKKISAIRKGENHEIEKSNSWRQAAEIFNVSEGSIAAARKILKFSSETFEDVKAGKLTLQQAKKLIETSEDSSILRKPDTEESPQTLVLSKREEQRVKELVEEYGMNSDKAKAYILKRRRVVTGKDREKKTLKEIKFRVSEEDKSELQKQAKSENKTVAELIRELLKLKIQR